VRNPARWRGSLWLGVYAGIVLLPLLIAAIDPPRRQREFAIEFGVSLGFIAFAVVALQFVLTARFPRLAAPFGLDALLHFHRLTGILALAALLAHVVLLVTARERFRDFLNPFDDFLRAFALWAVLVALTLIVVSTLWRRPLRIPYQWWRLVHGVLALFVIFVATVHIFQVNHYSADTWKMTLWAAFAAVAVVLLGWSRVVRPFRQLRRPYEVVEVRPETPRVWTVALEARGHDGMRFRAGQFAWLALAQKPWDVDSHPFSVASSAKDQGRIEFIVKELGDFTSGVGEIRVGSEAYLDGPYGNFVVEEDDQAVVLIVGGVGITPALSIIRTMWATNDRRPVWLIYAAGGMESVIRREELESLAQHEQMHLSLVLENPPAGWQGERGFITKDVLDRVLPPTSTPGIRYFICGPAPMMDAVEGALRQLRVSSADIRSERFNIA
jgi:predicted ferric reductase